MKLISKFSILLAAILLIFQTVSLPVSAMSQETHLEFNNVQAAIISDKTDEQVPLFEEETEISKTLLSLEAGYEVTVLQQGEELSLIQYEDSQTKETYEGYVYNQSLDINEEENLPDESEPEPESDSEAITQNKEDQKISQNDEEESNTNEKSIENEENEDEKDNAQYTEEEQNEETNESAEETKKTSSDATDDIEIENKQDKQSKSVTSNNDSSNTTKAKRTVQSVQEILNGVALKDSTNVYKSQSIDSEVLKTYDHGSVLMFKTLSSEWYEATVYVSGEYITGYIHVNDVETIVDSGQTLHGIGVENPTAIYQKASTGSDVIKTYEVGSVLKFETFTSQWYKATVYVSGKYTTGYIHKNHVEILSDSQTTLHGIGLKAPTYIYQKASTNSDVLKSYNQGSVLKYETFSSNWYEAVVYVNSQRKTGYIHKSHVENAVTDQVTLKGIALKKKTYVYTNASTSSKAWKSYSEGNVLTYQTFSNNWYKATVYVNGQRKTGYIHKSHVENAVSDQAGYRGIALKNETHVYTGASTAFDSWKSYPEGSVLYFQTFSDNWYEATVFVKGQRKTGYIHKSHIEKAVDNQKVLTGFALKKPTTVYSRASKNSSSLKSYNYGSRLKFDTFTKDWYEATVYINGQKRTGYIHAKDITFEDIKVETNYNITLAEALEIQKTANPQTTNEYNTFVSKSYISKDNKVTADVLNVRGGPSTNYWVVGQLTKGQNVTILNESGGWYQIEYTKKHQFVNASPDDVLYYLNPKNFINDTRLQFQFLDLSRNSAATADVLNKYLKGKGILSGQGKAFIDAGNKHGISDVYLISHAILETGNGSSTLATGVKYNGVTVYNMFGVGAYDSCPIDCGAKKAYEEGWTTPHKAIVGGAEFIGNRYIKAGLNTLYKMRWNPEAMDLTGAYGRQYATDIGWAAKQVNSMYNLYQQLDSYVLFLDVPTYRK